MFAYFPPDSEYIFFTPSNSRYSQPTRGCHYAQANRCFPNPRYHEGYYSRNRAHDVISELQNLERRRAIESAQQERRRRIQAEQENFLQQQAFRQWVLDQERERDATNFCGGKLRQNASQSKSGEGSNFSKTRKIPIQSGKSNISRQEAAERIVGFLRHRNANQKTRRTLHKLHQLGLIERHLNALQKQFNSEVVLTFHTEHEKQIFPSTPDNRTFLTQEESVLKIFDELDRIDSNNVEVIRERRKQIVRTAQKMLSDLDLIKDSQWKKLNVQDEQEDQISEAMQAQLKIDSEAIKTTTLTTATSEKLEEAIIQPYTILNSIEPDVEIAEQEMTLDTQMEAETSLSVNEENIEMAEESTKIENLFSTNNENTELSEQSAQSAISEKSLEPQSPDTMIEDQDEEPIQDSEKNTEYVIKQDNKIINNLESEDDFIIVDK
ncbi:hypothetical protein G9A89_002588 [Geosiphon pyriformis]|nr:hypothetical protein G9A89_003836 [Geosiphon pyriformis]KAG9298151.1 hypothetical protein G9A89_002588 [Geosiphon pyriformis]